MFAARPSTLASAPAASAGVRIDPVLVAVVGLVLGATLAVAALPGLLALVASALALARRVGARLLLLALLGVGLGGWRASAVLQAHASTWDAGRAFFPSPARCSGEGRITSSPTRRGPNLRFDAELTELDCEGRTSARLWPVRLYVPASSAPPLERGSTVFVIADLAPTSDFRNADLADPRPAAARRGAVLSGSALLVRLERRSVSGRAFIDRARAHVRERILATFAPSVSGLARALVLGESDLAPEDERAFQRSGLSHLLAVSGTHLVLAVLALVRGLEALAKRAECLSARWDVRRPAALLGLCLAPLYADFAGGSGSAWRAAYMLCAVLGLRVLGHYAFPSRVLACSLAGGWVGDALVVFDPSFMLSVGATTGLLVFGHGQDERQLARAAALTEPRRPDLGRLVRAVARAALTTLAATLPCVPLLLTISPGLSLASVAANLLAAPLGEAVALPLCLGHALCWPFPALERGVALVASGALALIRGIASTSASVEWLYFEIPSPNAWHLAVLAASVPIAIAPHARPWLETRVAASSAGARSAMAGAAMSRATAPAAAPAGARSPTRGSGSSPAVTATSEARPSLTSATWPSAGTMRWVLAPNAASNGPTRAEPASWPPDEERHGRQTLSLRQPEKPPSHAATPLAPHASRTSPSSVKPPGAVPPSAWPPSARPASARRSRTTALGAAPRGAGSFDASSPSEAWSRTWISAGQAIAPLPRQHRDRASRLSAAAILLGLVTLLLVETGTRWYHSAARHRAVHLLRVTALDVGQGDATLIDLPDGRLMLIDGGGNVGVPVDPGERVILPVLRARRRQRIDVLILTHPHPDHLGGLLSVARTLPVGELWYGGSTPPDGSDYQRLLDLLRERNVPLRNAADLCTATATAASPPSVDHPSLEQPSHEPPSAAADPSAAAVDAALASVAALPAALDAALARIGLASVTAPLDVSAPAPSTHLQILHPCPLDPSQSLNDNSLVLRITHGQHAALLMGDAEHWAEQRLLATHAAELGADLLKVGHHGSRTSSSPAFLQAVQPQLATISSGIRNRFAHPHAATLTHLQKAGTLPLRLDQLGSITWQTDGTTQQVQTWRTG